MNGKALSTVSKSHAVRKKEGMFSITVKRLSLIHIYTGVAFCSLAVTESVR